MGGGMWNQRGAEGTGHASTLRGTWSTGTGMLVRLAKFSTPRVDYDPVNVSDE